MIAMNTDTPSQIVSLVQEYRDKHSTMTEKEKAVMEQRIWELRPGGGLDRSEWLMKIIGESIVGTYVLDSRHYLEKYRAAADPFWTRIEEDLTLRTGMNLMRHAVHMARNRGISLEQAVNETLADYDALPLQTALGNGKFIRKKAFTTRTPAANPPVNIAPPIPPPPPVSITPSEPPPAISEEPDAKFWHGISTRIAEYINAEYDGIDEIQRSSLRREFETELKVTVERARKKIGKYRDQSRKRIAFTEVIAASEVLLMDPPKRGHLPDMTTAKRRMRTLAKEYHPDTVGNDSKKDDLQRVIDAYETLVSYCRQQAT